MTTPYRSVYRNVNIDAINNEERALETVSVSAQDGAHGADGHKGGHGSESGADGGKGTNAGAALRGKDSGAIRLRMATGNADGIVRLSGRQNSAGGAHKELDRIVTLGSTGTIDLLADGGRGGDGGNGGRGGDGATGSRGRNATRFEPGLGL